MCINQDGRLRKNRPPCPPTGGSLGRFLRGRLLRFEPKAVDIPSILSLDGIAVEEAFTGGSVGRFLRGRLRRFDSKAVEIPSMLSLDGLAVEEAFIGQVFSSVGTDVEVPKGTPPRIPTMSSVSRELVGTLVGSEGTSVGTLVDTTPISVGAFVLSGANWGQTEPPLLPLLDSC